MVCMCACENSDTDDDINPMSIFNDSYYPIETGREWCYTKVLDIDDEGYLCSEVSQETEVLGGYRYNRIYILDSLGNKAGNLFGRMDDDGRTILVTKKFLLNSPNGVLDDQFILIYDSLYIDSDEGQYLDTTSVSIKKRVVSTGLSKTVRGVEYKDVMEVETSCSINDFANSDEVVYGEPHFSYYAKGVGLISSGFRNPNILEVGYDTELVSYKTP